MLSYPMLQTDVELFIEIHLNAFPGYFLVPGDIIDILEGKMEFDH